MTLVEREALIDWAEKITLTVCGQGSSTTEDLIDLLVALRRECGRAPLSVDTLRRLEPGETGT